jgi:hypothetical protein
MDTFDSLRANFCLRWMDWIYKPYNNNEGTSQEDYFYNKYKQ